LVLLFDKGNFDYSKLTNDITTTKNLTGHFVSKNLIDFDIKTLVHKTTKTRYLYVYEVEYEKLKTIESTTLFEENDVIKIVAYDVKMKN